MFSVQGKFIGELCNSVRLRNNKTLEDISVLCQNKCYSKIKEFEEGNCYDANILISYLAMMNEKEIDKFYSIISMDKKYKSVFDDRIKYNFLSCFDEKFIRDFLSSKRVNYSVSRNFIALAAGVSEEFLKDFEEDFNLLLKELISTDTFISILNSDYLK